MGAASLILGILSLVMLAIEMFSYFSFGAVPTFFAIAGLISGITEIIQKRKRNEDCKQSIIGVILSSIYIIILIVTVITSVISMNQKINNLL